MEHSGQSSIQCDSWERECSPEWSRARTADAWAGQSNRTICTCANDAESHDQLLQILNWGFIPTDHLGEWLSSTEDQVEEWSDQHTLIPIPSTNLLASLHFTDIGPVVLTTPFVRILGIFLNYVLIEFILLAAVYWRQPVCQEPYQGFYRCSYLNPVVWCDPVREELLSLLCRWGPEAHRAVEQGFKPRLFISEAGLGIPMLERQRKNNVEVFSTFCGGY